MNEPQTKRTAVRNRISAKYHLLLMSDLIQFHVHVTYNSNNFAFYYRWHYTRIT